MYYCLLRYVTGGQVFALHAVVGEAGLDVEVVQQIAEGVFDVGGAVDHAHAGGTVIATEKVGHDGVLFRVGDVVEAHAEGSAEGHGEAVRNVAFHGQGRADGVDDAVLGVAEAHAGEGGAVQHGVAGGGVLAVGIGLTDVAGNELHGLEVQGVGDRGGRDAAEGFHSVHEGVNAGHGGHFRGQAEGQFGVEDDDVGVHVFGNHALLAAVLGVGEHGNVGHFRAGAGGGGDQDGGQAGVRHEVHAEVLVDGAFVGKQHGSGLRGVEGGTAAETDDHVSAESLGFVGAVLDGVHAGFQLGFGIQLPFDAAGGQGFFEGFLNADFGQTGVGHDEGLGTLQVLDFNRSLLDGAEAVYDLLNGIVRKSHCHILAC